MAHEAEKFNIALVSFYPGLVRTESVLRAAEYFDMSNSESPQFTGRVIAALAAQVADPGNLLKYGDCHGRIVTIAFFVRGYNNPVS